MRLELAAGGLRQGVYQLGLRQGAGGLGLGQGVSNLCYLWLGGGQVRLTFNSTHLRLDGEELGLGRGAGALRLAQAADVAQRPVADGACKHASTKQACTWLFTFSWRVCIRSNTSLGAWQYNIHLVPWAQQHCKADRLPLP